jgi:hypothetical protein
VVKQNVNYRAESIAWTLDQEAKTQATLSKIQSNHIDKHYATRAPLTKAKLTDLGVIDAEAAKKWKGKIHRIIMEYCDVGDMDFSIRGMQA